VSALRTAAGIQSPAALPETGWEPVSLPHHWEREWPEFEGTVWYRIDWTRTCAEDSDNASGAAPLAVALDYINMAGAVFANQTLLWRDPSLVEPLSRGWNTPRLLVLPDAALRPGRNALFIQVVGASRYDSGLGNTLVADIDTATTHQQRQNFFFRTLSIVNLVISATLGVFFLAVWLVRRKDAAYGWYALTSATWVLFFSNTVVTTPWPFGTTEGWSRFVTVAMTLFCSALYMFLWSFGGQRFPRLARVLWAGCGLVALLFLLMPRGWYSTATMAVFIGYVLLFISACLQFIVRAVFRTRETEHLLLAVCLVGFLIAAIHDTLGLLGLASNTSVLTPVTAPLITIGMALILASRFARSVQQAESFNAVLEGQIRIARDDLARTLTREHRLELDNVRLSERLQLAHDLHDGLGSSLVRSIALVEQSGSAIGSRQYLSMFKSLRDDLRQVIDTSSSASATVADTPLLWLAPIRYRFGQLFDELEIENEWRIPPAWASPPSTKQLLGLTRILEEALTNVIKHSRATRLRVSLSTQAGGETRLSVEDNGLGFDAAMVSESMLGIGLRSMQARASRIGGELRISSSREGICIEARIGGGSAAPAV
jgi:two-component system, NarL family, sensor histidine kinase UhpB